MRKVILYIAQSLDGFIARSDGDIGWLSIVEKENEDYGYGEFIKTIDTVIMGRKTYDKVLSFGIEFSHKGRKCYVLSNTHTGSDKNVEFYNGKIEDLIDALKIQEGADIFIDGGAQAVKSLRDKDLIDEYVISILPVMIGNGIRLFSETGTENRLRLLDCREYSTGLVQLRYERIK